MFTIYSTPTCAKCKMLKSWCEKNSISFSSVDITEDSDAHAILLSKGLSALPIISESDNFYSGDVKQLTDIIKNFSINK